MARPKQTKEQVHIKCQLFNNLPYITSDEEFTKGFVSYVCQKHGVVSCKWERHIKLQTSCPYCKGKRKKKIDIIEGSKKKHGDIYGYGKIPEDIDIKSHDKITLTCKKHNLDFDIIYSNHIATPPQGCPLCGAGKNRSTEDFKLLADEKHNKIYDYSKSVYKSATEKLEIICIKHGSFHMTPDMHINSSQGCPYCKTSKGEKRIMRFLDDKNIKYIFEYYDSKLIGPDCKKYRFDFYLPDINLVIEYHGQQHYLPVRFSNSVSLIEANERLKNRIKDDLIKEEILKNNNIKLITIPYTEYSNIELILEEINMNPELL